MNATCALGWWPPDFFSASDPVAIVLLRFVPQIRVGGLRDVLR